MKWTIKLYQKNGKIPVLEFIQSLPAKEQAKVEREIDLLEKFGIFLGQPHADKIKGEKYKGLWELRIKFSSNIMRVFYFLPKERTFVLLHAIKKKSNRPRISDLEIARRRMLDYIQQEVGS